MKKIIISSLFMVFGIFTNAQTTNDDYYNSSVKSRLFSKDRISASFMTGTSVSFYNKNSLVSTFIAPKINYELTYKFRLNVGFMHYSSHPNLIIQNENRTSSNNKNISSDLLFVGGEYLLNKKLSVSGAVMTNVSSLNNKQNNYKAAAIGFDYKVSEHSTIGIRAGVSQGDQNYMFNPKNNNFDYYPSADRSNGLINGFGQWGADELNRNIR
jgi:hypothetical protein